MKQTAVEFFSKGLENLQYNPLEKNGYENAKQKLLDQAKEMEKEQNESILNYIKEVRDLCDKLRFPTEEELRELVIKADNILLTFKLE